MRTCGTVIAFAVASALAVTGCGGGGKSNSGPGASTPATQPTRAAPTKATISALRALARSSGHDIFWAGRKRGYSYELTQTSGGNTYIRYLPPGVPIGAAGADFLSVGSYPQADAFATIKAARKQAGEVVTNLKDGGQAVANPNRPQSVYFAYPGSKVLVEVYDPSPARAAALVKRNKVVPVR
jgi:hypothetical protein